MQNSAVRLKAIKTGGNSLNPPASMTLNLLSGAISSLVTFTRATTATVTDWEGLIKNTKSGEARFDGMRRVENLLTYSQDFSNAVWVKAASTVTTDAIAAPDGTLTADKLVASVTTGDHYLRYDYAITSAAIFSVYAKAAEETIFAIGNATASTAVIFNLSNGTVSSPSEGSITPVGNGWYRCTYYRSIWLNWQYISLRGNRTSYTGDGTSGIYIWGAQLENVTGQTNQNPSEYVSTNAIRRNLLTYSEQFDNAVWTKQNSTVTANAVVAPDGTLTADKLIPTVLNAQHWVNNVGVSTGIVPTTFSFYSKAGEYSYVACYAADGNVGQAFSLIDGSILGNTGGVAPTSRSCTSVGNGWYRCTITWTPISGVGVTPRIYAMIDSTTTVFAGDGTSGIYVWGAQFEVGPAATAYQKVTDAGPQDFNNYQGAAVDGVQYFPYTNPNCIINGVITQIPTIAINSSKSKFAYNCVASGDYFSTPSATANQITGDISMLVQVALDDWTPATVQTLVAKDGVTSQRSYAFNVQPSGALRLNYSLDGSTITSITSTASTGFTDGTVHFVGVQREAATGIVRFYTSEDGTTFTQLGTQQTGTAGNLFNSTTPVQFGNLSSLAFELNGKIYDSHIYTGLKFTGFSTMVVDFDPSDWTSGTSWVGPETGETWTINGNAKVYQGLWDAVGPKSLLIEEARTNVFLNSTAPATQSFTTAASPYTISFYGSGSITLSGSFVATVTGSNALTRTTLTFTPTAALLTMTVAGTITKPQLELGGFATSYIETAGSQVTRNADQASMTGTNFSSWYNSSAGTFYVEGDYLASPSSITVGSADGTFINATDATVSNNMALVRGNSGPFTPKFYINNGGVNVFNTPVGTTWVANTMGKLIGAYATNNGAECFNGGTIVSTATLSVPTVNTLYIGYFSPTSGALDGHIRTIRYYRQRLPNTTLQSLTA